MVLKKNTSIHKNNNKKDSILYSNTLKNKDISSSSTTTTISSSTTNSSQKSNSSTLVNKSKSSKAIYHESSYKESQKNLFGQKIDESNISTDTSTNSLRSDSTLEDESSKNEVLSSPKTFKDEIKTIQKSLIPKAKTGEEFKKSWLYLILGFCMGIVDAIPGISGSTVSLLVKQYEFVMRTFSKILSKFFLMQGFKSVKRGFESFSITPIKNHFYEFKLYIPILLGIGIVVGILLSFVTIARLIENYELIMMKLFFIFTLGVSIYYLYLHKQIFKENYKKPTPMVTFSVSLFLILVLLSYYTDNSLSTLSLIIFSIAGFISIVAMLLPGLSGSLVLLLLGVYVPLKDALLSFDLQILFAFIGGTILGAVSSIKLIAYLSSNYSIHLKFFILSVLIASTINLWLMAF